MSDLQVHHLALTRQAIEGAKIALLPGDPGRVPKIAGFLDNAKELAFNREYRSFLGNLDGKPVLVISSGIGGPALSVCVEELARLGIDTFIRVGTCGAIQKEIEIGEKIITTGAVRLDGASRSFAPIEYPAVANIDVVNAIVAAARKSGRRFHVGLTASSDTFYQGQERYDTFSGFVPAHLRGSLKEWQSLNVLNFEMEAATLLTMCSTMRLRAGCICGVLANRMEGEKLPTKEQIESTEIETIEIAIEAVRQLLTAACSASLV
jgi:uridine phosphorylase